MIKLSIITVTFNSEKTLEKTIMSVFEQGYENLEYIIIDGGSTDSTLDIIKKYETKLAYWVSEKDNGISDAFNKGIQKATGDVIGIINSDDRYCKNIFYKINKSFEKEIDFLFGDLLIEDLNGNTLKTMKSSFSNTFPYGGMPFGHPTLFIKKEIYYGVGFFNINYKVAMDFELLTRFYKNYKGYYLEENIAIYSRGGISDKYFIRGHKEVFASTIVSENSNFLYAYFQFLIRVCRTILRKIIEFFKNII